jgi:hypothetical protein
LLGNCNCQQPAGGTPALPGRYESKKYAALGGTPALPGCHGSKKYAALSETPLFANNLSPEKISDVKQAFIYT